LILVGTKEHAYRILELVHSYGLGEVCRCSFGGGTYFRFDEEKNSVVKCKDEDTMEGFESGKLKILIGTSHIYEGADIPNLDIIILASVGKGLRKYIQGVGRGLRRSKTGKYAHIIDFTDHYDRVLAKHSHDRLDMFRTVIGVSDSNIYDSLSFEKFKQMFCSIEGIT
jgi:superfamily II DNA/RNA helicase